MNCQFCPICKKEYEFWATDPHAEYVCGYCCEAICVDGKHDYLYCSKTCEDNSVAEYITEKIDRADKKFFDDLIEVEKFRRKFGF